MIPAQMIIRIDEGADFDSLPEEQQDDIKTAGVKWPEGVMIGTKAVNGKIILLIVTSASELELSGMILAHGLDWEVLAVEGEQINQALLLPFYSDAPIFDESGDQIGTEAVTDLTGKIQTISGHAWSY